jgi:hypothetical protein
MASRDQRADGAAAGEARQSVQPDENQIVNRQGESDDFSCVRHGLDVRDGRKQSSMSVYRLARAHPMELIAAVISWRAGAPYTARPASAAKVSAYMATSCACVTVR